MGLCAACVGVASAAVPSIDDGMLCGGKNDDAVETVDVDVALGLKLDASCDTFGDPEIWLVEISSAEAATVATVAGSVGKDVSLAVSDVFALTETGVAIALGTNAYAIAGCAGTTGCCDSVNVQLTLVDTGSDEVVLRSLVGITNFEPCELPARPAVSIEDSRTCAKPGIRFVVCAVCDDVAMSVFAIAGARSPAAIGAAPILVSICVVRTRHGECTRVAKTKKLRFLFFVALTIRRIRG
jgi:hypothetical protein